MKIKHIACGVAAIAMFACSGEKGWQVSGTIEGAGEDAKVAVQAFNAGRWYTIDSLELGKGGKFSYRAPEAVAYPDIYRVSLDGKSIYFPVYGKEAISITANADDIEGTYTIEGSADAQSIREIDQRIRQQVASQGVDKVLADSVLKRELNEQALGDTVGIVAYYIINKSIGGRPLYAANNSRDIAMLGAVAQRFQTSMPDDPRTAVLAQQYLDAKRALASGNGPVIELEGDGYIDIALYDEKGQERKLSDEVKGTTVVLLSFTSYALESSLAYNHELNQVLEQVPGTKIYQVSVDQDEVAWRETAQNLPWTTVQLNPVTGDNLLMQYNVGVVPLTYVIVDGNIVERVINPTEITAAIRKHK